MHVRTKVRNIRIDVEKRMKVVDSVIVCFSFVSYRKPYHGYIYVIFDGKRVSVYIVEMYLNFPLYTQSNLNVRLFLSDGVSSTIVVCWIKVYKKRQ